MSPTYMRHSHIAFWNFQQSQDEMFDGCLYYKFNYIFKFLYCWWPLYLNITILLAFSWPVIWHLYANDSKTFWYISIFLKFFSWCHSALRAEIDNHLLGRYYSYYHGIQKINYLSIAISLDLCQIASDKRKKNVNIIILVFKVITIYPVLKMCQTWRGPKCYIIRL
jgi:hypothetical protein